MTMTQKPHSSFNGTFDPSIRKKFKEKRRSVGVSLEQLGDFLKTHWSTVRKWEAGITTTCHPRHISHIAAFLNGEFDRELRKKYRIDILSTYLSAPQDQSEAVLPLKLPTQLERALIQSLEKLFVETLTRYLKQLLHSNDQ